MSFNSRWIKKVKLKDGRMILLRPEVASDLEMLWEMYSTLSEESLRFLPAPFTRDLVEGWVRNLNFDYVLPILAICEVDGKERIVGAATLQFFHDNVNKHKAEFGIAIHDDFQNLGLGTLLTLDMVEIARRKGLKKVCLNVVLGNNRAMKVYERCGFKVEGLMLMNHFNVHTNAYGNDYSMAILL